MAIQFQCAACSEPIEIDAEWGGKLVACPYCRKAILAPAESTYDPPPRMPAARPLAAGSMRLGEARLGGATFEAVSVAGAAPYRGDRYEAGAASGNAAAVWAMGLTLGALLCLAISVGLFAANFESIEPIVEMKLSGKPMHEVNQVMLERFGGTVPGWFLAFGLCMVSALGLWLAGLICGLVAVRRPYRRKLAITSVLLSTATLFLVLLMQRA